MSRDIDEFIDEIINPYHTHDKALKREPSFPI